MEYNFSSIEKKWQAYWESNKTFKSKIDKSKPKFYGLDMFPYPSGEGLHVGHPEGYTATDIICRYKRMNGFNVLHPMGWDSFGLPAENYAMKVGIHPKIVTEKNINTFRRQLKALGFSYDWDREVATSSEDYYKWTQWIFTEIYKKGLAYEDEVQVNWCPELKTVLANEEIVDGKSEVGGHPVVRMPMKQWVLKITDYADRLLKDIDELDWPENIKEMQRNWIGRSEGANLKFKIKNSNESIEVFTTRPDTLFGATYMVLAPEHHLVKQVTTKDYKESVEKYINDSSKKSDLERTDLNKNKTGVFTGAYAINPVNHQEIPIWIADYVLISYGFGAIMAVPAHDTRDYEFAKKFNLPIIQVLEGGNIDEEAFVGDGNHVNSDFINGLNKSDAINKMNDWLEKNKIGKKAINYKIRDWIFCRQRFWGEPFPIIKFDDGSIRCLNKEELPVTLPDVKSYKASETMESPLSTITEWVNVKDKVTNQNGKRETNTMPQWAGSCWYYLRFISPHNKDKAWDAEEEKYWMPVDLYVGGTEHAVLHLLYARFWHKILYDLGFVSTKEPFHKLVNQGLILGEDGEKMSKSRGNVVNPDKVVEEYGADSLRLYEMFMGPFEKVKPWAENGIKGVFGFLSRVYRFAINPDSLIDNEDDLETKKLLHKTIKKVTEDIETMKFNTAISQMMIFTNHITKVGKLNKDSMKSFVQLLTPFAPHMGEELWEMLGNKNTITYSAWPKFDPLLAKDDVITMAISVNGKTKATIEVPVDITQDEFLRTAKNEEKIAALLKDKTIVKEIYVPGKICNFVVK